MREPREFMREILDMNPPRVSRQSWGFMRRILDKNPPSHGRQIHKDSTYEKVNISKRKGSEMNPAHPRNERARKRIWAQNGVISTLDFGNHILICRTCARPPETISLDSERANQTLNPCPKS